MRHARMVRKLHRGKVRSVLRNANLFIGTREVHGESQQVRRRVVVALGEQHR